MSISMLFHSMEDLTVEVPSPFNFPVMRFFIVHIVFILSAVKTLGNDLVCLFENKKSLTLRNVSNWICSMLLSTYRKKFEKKIKTVIKNVSSTN